MELDLRKNFPALSVLRWQFVSLVFVEEERKHWGAWASSHRLAVLCTHHHQEVCAEHLLRAHFNTLSQGPRDGSRQLSSVSPYRGGRADTLRNI